MPWLAKDAVFQRLASIAEVAALSKEERQKYDESLRKYRDTISVMEGQFLEGMEKGLAKGRAEEKSEIARNLKQMGLSVADIVKATGLTAEEVGSL